MSRRPSLLPSVTMTTRQQDAPYARKGCLQRYDIYIAVVSVMYARRNCILMQVLPMYY